MITQPKRIEYDVCIVGSGAGGGIAAHALTKAGANVVMLEAGGWWDNARDSKMLTWPWQTPRRGASTKERPFGEYDACIGGCRLFAILAVDERGHLLQEHDQRRGDGVEMCR